MTVAAASDSIQDNLLQSMLGEAGTAGQPLSMQAGFTHLERSLQPPAESRR